MSKTFTGIWQNTIFVSGVILNFQSHTHTGIYFPIFYEISDFLHDTCTKEHCYFWKSNCLSRKMFLD